MRFLEIGESLLSPNDRCIAPLLLGGIIAAGASLAGNVIGASSQSSTNDMSKDIAEMNNKFNAEQDLILILVSASRRQPSGIGPRTVCTDST